ncbi:MAG: peptidase M14 [Ruminococcaceae bacterium]|nr:peptidase M14 [Oscillospiraceae bacterium]
MKLINKKGYDYENLIRDIDKLGKRYPFCDIFSIGESVTKKEIICIKLGSGSINVLYNGAHHGAEWITSALLMKFIEEYSEAYVGGKKIGEISAAFLMENVSLYVVPMVNPDGVDIAVNGARKYTADFPRLFRENNNSSDFSGWKANFNGVDLNHNYDALWELSRDGEEKEGIFGPGPTKYAGEAPFSEPETVAMKNLTEENDFKITVSFHSQGREVYYNFNGKEPIYSGFLAKALTLGSPYNVVIPQGSASYGGYKDWFIETTGRLGFTVEVGEGENPIPISELSGIYKETLQILTGGMKIACLI